jgi:hypothetical protein
VGQGTAIVRSGAKSESLGVETKSTVLATFAVTMQAPPMHAGATPPST